jgi:hypothetical protein
MRRLRESDATGSDWYHEVRMTAAFARSKILSGMARSGTDVVLVRGRIVTMTGKSMCMKACDLDRLAGARHG